MMKYRLKKLSGFTLIELMVVVAIIGVLVAVGYPSYTDYIMRGHRSEGRTMLVDAATRLERLYSDTNNHAAVLNTLPSDIATTSLNNLYTLTMVNNPDNQSYVLRAEKIVGGTADPGCPILTLDNIGRRGIAITLNNPQVSCTGADVCAGTNLTADGCWQR